MKSFTSRRFREMYANLPRDINSARTALTLTLPKSAVGIAPWAEWMVRYCVVLDRSSF